MRFQKQGWSNIRQTAERYSSILLPGLYVKRWVLPSVLGVVIASAGIALLLSLLLPFGLLTRSPLWTGIIGGACLVAGSIGGIYGFWRLNRAMARLLLDREGPIDNLALMETIVQRQQQRRRRTGPKVVVIGGGTGMPTLLRGLRHYTENITAVVTVADDGGSSGLLRQQMGVLPPGDFRNNIAALSDSEDLMTQVLQYRFGDSDGLGNHNFGNLFITTMAAIAGSFERGIEESSRVLAVRGRILPSTLDHVTLCAEVAVPFSPEPNAPEPNVPEPTDRSANADETPSPPPQNDPAQSDPAQTGSRKNGDDSPRERIVYVRGESNIPASDGRILQMHLEPEECRAYPPTIRAILEADLIVAAPGSFFTSLMPNLLVPHICEAIIASNALRVYVCNVAGQKGETNGFSVSDHMRHLRQHAGNAFTKVLANNHYDLETPPAAGIEWVTLPPKNEALSYQLYQADLVEEARPWRHDADKVAAQLIALYEETREVNLGRALSSVPPLSSADKRNRFR